MFLWSILFQAQEKSGYKCSLYIDTCWLYMNGYNQKGSYILLLTVHVLLKIVDFIHQCTYTDITATSGWKVKIFS